jgi:PST family polysaccharide transporter
MLAMATLKGATWLVLSRIIGRIVDFFTLLILARLLVPADFGHAAMAMALVAIVDMVLEVPVTQALVRLPLVDKGHLDTGFTLGILRSILVGLVVLATAWPYSVINNDPSLFALCCVLAIGPAAKGLSSPAMVFFERSINFRPLFILETISKLAGFVAAVIVVLNGGGYWALVVNYTTAATVGSLLSYMFARYQPVLSLARSKDFMGFMGWFTSFQVISAISWQYDRLMIGTMSADKAILGRFAVANDVANIPTQSLIGPALHPVMAAFSNISSDRERLRLAFLKAARVAMLVSIPLGLGVSLTSDLVIHVLLGDQWQGAAPYLALLSISVLPVPYFQTIYSVSLALNRLDVIFRLSMIDLLIRLVVLTTGFYFLAVEGAVYGRVILALAMFFLYMLQIRTLLNVSVTRQIANLWKIAVSGAVMTIAVLAFRAELSSENLPQIIQLLMVSSLGAATYFCTLFGLGLRLEFGPGRLELSDRR